MTEFFLHYAGANFFCIIIFSILLGHDLVSVDRQEKQIKYDHALTAFIFYFAADIFWAALTARMIPFNRFTVIINTLSVYVGMCLITYTWLNYAMALEQVPHRNRKVNKFAVIFPFLVSSLILILTYLIKPHVLINDANELQPSFNYFLVTVPYINLAAVMFYTIKEAKSEENPIEKRRHIYVGFFPLMVIIGGLIQMIFCPNIPLFCFSATVLMLIFFIQSMETQISVDPLTGLNNRGQLLRYVSQKSNTHKEERLTYVIMIDVNDFKKINDTYGHAEGDKALTILADSLKRVVNNHNMPVFLGRYGGDEFILIVHPLEKDEVDTFIKELRTEIENECKSHDTQYDISVGIGYDELMEDPDTFQKCMQRADKKLYLDKEYCKLHGKPANS